MLASMLVVRCHSARGRLNEVGATAVEYSILVAFIATVIVVAVRALGLSLIPGFVTVTDGITTP